jgi:phospholipase A-2-activating protein
MYPDEIRLIDEAFTYLTQALAVPPIEPTGHLRADHVEAIMQILDRWPLSQRFPGGRYRTFPETIYLYFFWLVIDLSRLVICFRAGASSNPGVRERLLQCLFKASEWDDTWSIPLSKTKQTNILLLLRTIANAFQEGTPVDQGKWVIQVFRGPLVETPAYCLCKAFERLGNGPYEAFNKAQRVAIATILFKSVNISLHLEQASYTFPPLASPVLTLARPWHQTFARYI